MRHAIHHQTTMVRGLCALLVLGGLPPVAAAAADGPGHERPAARPATDWRIDLAAASADQHNIDHRGNGALTIGDRRARTTSAPGRAFAVYTAPARSLGRQADAFTIHPRAYVPAGTQVVTEVRGSDHLGTVDAVDHPDRTGRLRLAQAVSVVQVRLTLLGTRTAEPVVSASLRTRRPRPARSPGTPRADRGLTDVLSRVFATREGLAGRDHGQRP
ncbi:hypothetical protein ACRAWF_17235 [Streptomyces sp. L7]